MDAEQLFSDYDFYRLHTVAFQSKQKSGQYMRSMSRDGDPHRSDRLVHFESLLAFCGDRGVEPGLYLYSLFEARSWLCSPNIDHLVPKTKKTEKKAISRFHALGEVPLYSERMRMRREARGDTVQFDPNRDISEGVESWKRRYVSLGQYSRCMTESLTLTLGFHPRSSVCAVCPVAVACETLIQTRVSFDIVALRKGDITSDEARRMEGMRHGPN